MFLVKPNRKEPRPSRLSAADIAAHLEYEGIVAAQNEMEKILASLREDDDDRAGVILKAWATRRE